MYYHNESDETLVMLTLAGEQTAYEVLVKRYEKAVIASAISVTKNYYIAEDSAQDAFVTAWMKLDTLQDHKKYGSWVCRIAKNCALNTIGRYRSFLPLDVVDNLDIYCESSQNPAELYALSEEKSQVNKSIETLPDKIRQIIRLHYFEGLSISEISEQMRIPEGTVKWQLHDGRKRIRKELCAMNEKYSDTLVQRVMKKVEELKLWQVKNNKSGFEKVYKEVLGAVEELPECMEKKHALADVLMRGWWWIPGKKNDALFARIVDAAIEGKNEEVMSFVVAREDSKTYRGARVAFIRDKQIPRLEKAGFVKTLGREWFWLGYNLFREGKAEEGRAAYGKIKEILAKGDSFRVLVPYALKMEDELLSRYKDTVKELYTIGGAVEQYRIIDGKTRYWSEDGFFSEGCLCSIDRNSSHIFRNASSCDGYFTVDASVGETFLGSDGSKLTYLSDNEVAETPAGKFEACQLWEVRRWTDSQKIVSRTYYKDGIGIVRQEHICDGFTSTNSLYEYSIKGGKGLVPMFEGNTWEYVSDHPSNQIKSEIKFAVSYADDERFLVSRWENIERCGYDNSSWLDTIQEIANDYCYHKNDGKGEYINDVYPAIDRAEKLAVTPMEKAHSKAAVSVAKRILETDGEFNPERNCKGHWNFFTRSYIKKNTDNVTKTGYDPRWSFEWKNTSGIGNAGWPILCNDILGILQDAANCIWSDEWCIGATPIVEYTTWARDVKTQIFCEDGGTITTKAGTFENCLRLRLDIEGMEDGWEYRGGKKVYYFANGIGIVRTESEFCGGAKKAIYELTSYEGVGEGYMPFNDGFTRRYDAIGLTDGYVGAAIYTYVADDDGDIVVFADRTGIRELPPPITQYSAIEGEEMEERLWDQGDWQATHVKNGANNFHLILHLLARPSYNRNNAKRSVEINGFNLDLLHLLGEDGVVPPAWQGLCAWRAVVRAAALFGDKQKDAGYEQLELALKACEQIAQFKDGDLLDAGKKYLLGGAQYEYGRGVILLSDGTREPVSYQWEMECDASTVYYSLTASRGWSWFNSVRNEERFKEYVERAKILAGK